MFKTFTLHLVNNNTTNTMNGNDLVANALAEFETRWGLQPNGVVIHPKTFNTQMDNLVKYWNDETKQFEVFGIKVFRSFDIEENKIRFVL